MVPVMHAAEQTEALRRKQGAASRIADYTVSGYEVPLNRILADLLSPRGAHGQGDLLLKSFLDLLGLAASSSEQWLVIPNYKTIPGRKPDIAMFLPAKIAIYIESKPWADEGVDQINDYAVDLLQHDVARRVLVFLPGLASRQPSNLRADVKARLGGLEKIPFQRREDERSIVQWLERCASRCEAENVRVFIADLAGYLNSEFNEDDGAPLMSDDPFIRTMIDPIRRNRDYLQLTFRLGRAATELRHRIAKDFFVELEAALAAKTGPSDWRATNSFFDPWERYQGIDMKKAGWPDGWGVHLAMDTADLKDFRIGFACPSTAGHLVDAELARDTPLASKADRARILGVLEEPLTAIGRSAQTDSWWPAFCRLPEPFRSWESDGVFLQLEGLEPTADGRLAAEMFVSWLQSLATAVEQTVDDILAGHASARGGEGDRRPTRTKARLRART